MSIDYCISIIEWILKCPHHEIKEINNMSLDLDKIKKELEVLPKYKEQIALQSNTKDNLDPFYPYIMQKYLISMVK